MSQWPSTKARVVLVALFRIGWTIKRQSGTSHRVLSRSGWSDLIFAFHAAIEPHGTICQWHLDDSITIWANTQGPHRLKERLYNVSGLPEDKVRVIKAVVGGGFGGKTGALEWPKV